MTAESAYKVNYENMHIRYKESHESSPIMVFRQATLILSLSRGESHDIAGLRLARLAVVYCMPRRHPASFLASVHPPRFSHFSTTSTLKTDDLSAFMHNTLIVCYYFVYLMLFLAASYSIRGRSAY